MLKQNTDVDKRKFRSPVVLDMDDLLILEFLIEQKKSWKEPQKCKVYLSEILQHTKLSPNALVIHLERLKDFVVISRDEFNYKFKIARVTSKGEKFFYSSLDSDQNKLKFQDFKVKLLKTPTS